MKRCQHSFSLLRWYRVRYFDSNINWRSGLATYNGQKGGEVALIQRSTIRTKDCLGLRWYSNGFLGVNRVPANYDDIPSVDVGKTSQNVNDLRQLGGSGTRSGIENYGQNVGQNVGQFQHQSSPRSHYTANDWTSSQNFGHHAVENVGADLRRPGGQNVGEFQQSSPRSHYTANEWTSPQKFGHHRMENSGADLQRPGYSSEANAATGQQMTGDHWIRNSGQGAMYKGNQVVSHPSGYQPERMGLPPSSNGHPQANLGVHIGNPSGFSNGNPGPHHPNFVGSHNSMVHAQSSPSAAPNVRSVQDDRCDDDTNTASLLEEFDAFCKDWDLEQAVESMSKLGEKGVHLDLPRYLTLMEACGEAKALQEAKAVHQHLVRFMSPVKVSTFNRILEMYGKCGLMQNAYDMFNQMPERNLTSWDTMISWLAKNGLGEDAIDMFTRFKEAGLKPDGEMFFAIFDACGVIGDVTEGLLHFESMSKIYGITPSMAHYASIVHMFGSAGYLDGALEFIEKMPVEPSVDVWESLMNISRVQGNVELGDRCAQIVEQLDASRLTKESKSGLLPVKESDSLKKKVKKANPLEHTKHEYRAGDRSHPENDKIYAILRGIKESMKEAGYVPETRFVLHDIDPEGKEEAIMAHSERLACTYALITSAARMPIRIIKNLRVCGDCHNAFKIISKLVGRLVIMRDAKRFHHFENGKCSCNDYW